MAAAETNGVSETVLKDQNDEGAAQNLKRAANVEEGDAEQAKQAKLDALYGGSTDDDYQAAIEIIVDIATSRGYKKEFVRADIEKIEKTLDKEMTLVQLVEDSPARRLKELVDLWFEIEEPISDGEDDDEEDIGDSEDDEDDDEEDDEEGGEEDDDEDEEGGDGDGAEGAGGDSKD